MAPIHYEQVYVSGMPACNLRLPPLQPSKFFASFFSPHRLISRSLCNRFKLCCGVRYSDLRLINTTTEVVSDLRIEPGPRLPAASLMRYPQLLRRFRSGFLLRWN